MYRKHLPGNPDADQLAHMIESMSDAEWEQLTENIPAAIAAGDPLDFDADRPVTVDQLMATIGR